MMIESCGKQNLRAKFTRFVQAWAIRICLRSRHQAYGADVALYDNLFCPILNDTLRC
jgi:hypothetical protein